MGLSARSVLYVPGHRGSMLAKIVSLGADLFVVDLEDGVPPTEKSAARDTVRAAAREGQLPAERWALRVNAAGSAWCDDDLDLVEELAPPYAVLPKAEHVTATQTIAGRWRARDVATCLMIETARGVGFARELACCSPGIAALMYGSADLRRSLGSRDDGSRTWERHAMGQILLAARIAGCAAIDAVTFQFRDTALLERDARIARDLGFDGKSCIHPGQLETIHQVFSSTAEEIAWAEKVTRAWQQQDGAGSGVVDMDGEMIEALHLDIARRILDRRSTV